MKSAICSVLLFSKKAVLLAFSALALCSCAGPQPRVEPAALSLQPSGAQPGRPLLVLPPPPARKSESELWKEALQRGDALAPVIEKDIAAAQPGPLPAKPGLSPSQAPKPPPATGAAIARAPEPVPSKPAPSPEVSKPAPAGSAAAPSQARPAPPAPVVAQAAAKPGGAAAPVGKRVSAPQLQVVKKYTTENGLPSNRITALFVDDEDAWVGTADAGLARLNFAEGNWLITKAEDGLASNHVTDIIKYKGRVYVGTQDGISVWDGASWSNQTAVENVRLLNCVFRIHDELLWVAARNMYGGFLTFDGQSWKNRSNIRPGTLLNNISDFTFAGKTLWIGTTNRGAYRFDGKDWAAFTVADGLASNFIYTLAAGNAASYLGGCCGVSSLEGGNWKIYDVAEGLPHSTVNVIAMDGEVVWFGSKKGLAVFNGLDFTNFYTDMGLTDDRITALFVRQKELWVGTANGLNRLEKSY